jgi:hypothetical protein
MDLPEVPAAMMVSVLPPPDLTFQPPALAALASLSFGMTEDLPEEVPSARFLDHDALRDAAIERALELEAPASIAPVLVRGVVRPATVRDPEAAPMILPIVDVERSFTEDGAALKNLSEGALTLLARRLGWLPRIVRARDAESRHQALSEAMTWARHEMLVLRALAREGVVPSRISWPVVFLCEASGE